MNIFSKPIHDLTYADVEEFVNLKIKENDAVEYKEAWPKQSIAYWLCSFANTHGGLILIGVAEDGKSKPSAICGIPNDQAKTDNVDQAAYKVMPPMHGHWESVAVPLAQRSEQISPHHPHKSGTSGRTLQCRWRMFCQD